MAAVICVLVISGVIAVRNIHELQESRGWVAHTLQVLATLREIETGVMDVESSQRGYLITSDIAHLEPIGGAERMARSAIDEVADFTADQPRQQIAIAELRELVEVRLTELKQVLDVRKTTGEDAANAAVVADSAKRTMRRIVDKIESMRAVERDLLAERQEIARRAYRSGIITSVMSTIIGVGLVCGVLYLLERNRRKAERAAGEIQTVRQRLRLALDAAELGSWNIDPHKESLICDAQFRTLSCGEDRPMTYEQSFGWVHPDDRNAVRNAVAASIDPDHPKPYALDYRVIHHDGSVHWITACGKAVFGEGEDRNRLNSFDGTVADITQRKEHEQRLKKSEQLARAANQSKSEFLANMSHEIRTPMAAILGYSDVLLGHLEDPDNRNCVLVMKRNGEHLLELINDILDLSRIEAGKLDVELESVPLPRLISDIHSLMHVRAEEKGLEFRAEFATKVPEQIQTDPTRLRQVLINLIGNAIKFTESGSVMVLVAYEPISRFGVRHGSNGDGTGANAQTASLTIAVRDTGIGISEEQQSKLFKPFSQADSSVTRSFGGSGLGLAISQRLAGMLGGDIRIASEPGQGSTFTVVLPMPAIDESELIEARLDIAPKPADVLASKDIRLNCHVLVVDDRRDVRHISQHFLEKAGATVITAENGQQGIDKALAARDSDQPIHLIVMDMQMPIVDGMQATGRLRSAGITCPIIALTADAMKGDRDKCLDGGCDDYLSKPIDQAKLIRLVANYTQTIPAAELQTRRKERLMKRKAVAEETT